MGGENQDIIQEGDGIQGLEIKKEPLYWVNNVETGGEECGLKRGEEWIRPVS